MTASCGCKVQTVKELWTKHNRVWQQVVHTCNRTSYGTIAVASKARPIQVR